VTETHASAEELAAYIDGKVGPDEWNRLVTHLATCEACFRDLVAIMKLMKPDPDAAPR
jgi:anti-sigma factor RsiW